MFKKDDRVRFRLEGKYYYGTVTEPRDRFTKVEWDGPTLPWGVRKEADPRPTSAERNEELDLIPVETPTFDAGDRVVLCYRSPSPRNGDTGTVINKIGDTYTVKWDNGARFWAYPASLKPLNPAHDPLLLDQKREPEPASCAEKQPKQTLVQAKTEALVKTLREAARLKKEADAVIEAAAAAVEAVVNANKELADAVLAEAGVQS